MSQSQPRSARDVKSLLGAALATWALAAAACSGQNTGLDPSLGPGSATHEPALTAGCNPLGGGPGEDCFTPFPSSYYTERDARGIERIKIPAPVLPSSLKGIAIDPALLNGRDGFSPATPIIAYFPSLKSRIDPAFLPLFSAPADSLTPKSTVQLFEYDTGLPVPLMAEVDRNASDGERQAILIYPHVRLRPQSRYVVSIRGLRTTAGQPVPPLSGFASLRDDKLDAGSVRSSLKGRYGEIFALLEKKGVARKDLQAAWDFTTASDDPVSGRMVRMRDRAFAFKPMGTPPVKIATVNEKPNAHLLRQIIGMFLGPSFLTDDASGRLQLGPDGEPQLRGLGAFPLVIHIPACVDTAPGPVPVMIYGHGLFGGALDEMDSGYQREIIDRLCMVQIGTDWIGLSEADKTYVIANVLGNFNNIVQLTDRLQQAHINFAYLSHLIATGALDELSELHWMGRMTIDKSRIYYYGISNGGIQGVGALALSPHFARGALNVPGGFWSRMMWRSADFSQFALFLAGNYPDPLDRQLLVALSQSLWDYSDPATYAPHILSDPLPGSGGPKRVLYQEGLGDAQVPNLSTRAIVRTMGLPLLNQPIEPVFGVNQVGAAESAYVQYDVGQLPRPGDTNVPPPDNPVHEAIRRLEAAKVQLQLFLKEDGKVTDSCAGKPCYFPAP